MYTHARFQNSRGKKRISRTKLWFENKVALVTGAGQGMGLAAARAFAEEGVAVALADRDEALVRKAAKDLTKEGHKAIAIRCDVTNEQQQMCKQGSGAIVNNSSIGCLIGLPGRAIYHAAKHGVIGLTKSAALEYAARASRSMRYVPAPSIHLWLPE